MELSQKIAPCLWFDNQGEEAATFYTGIFKNSKVVNVARYGKAGQEIHKQKPGSVMTLAFELDGQPFTALNGGPIFKFNEAISLQFIATRRRKSIITGRSCPRAAISRHSSAAGSKTNTDSPGKSFRRF